MQSKDFGHFNPPSPSPKPLTTHSASTNAARASDLIRPTESEVQILPFNKTFEDPQPFQTPLKTANTVLSPAPNISIGTADTLPHSTADVCVKRGFGSNRPNHLYSQPHRTSSLLKILCSPKPISAPCRSINPFEDHNTFYPGQRRGFPKIGDRIKVFKIHPNVTRRAKVIRRVDDTHFLLSYSDYTLDRKIAFQAETIGVFHNETVCLQSLRWS